MRKTINKAKAIVKGNLAPLPVDQEWYQERLSICSTCPLNTNNMKEEDIKISRKIVINTLAGGQGVCDACGCPIHKKAGVITEVCGMDNLKEGDSRKEVAKWPAVEVYSILDKSLRMVNLSTDVAKLSVEPEKFVYNTGSVTKNVVKYKFQLHRAGGIKIKDFSIGCGCTVAEQEVVDDNTVNLNVTISLLRFNYNVEEGRSMVINYTESASDSKVRSATVRFKIIRTK